MLQQFALDELTSHLHRKRIRSSMCVMSAFPLLAYGINFTDAFGLVSGSGTKEEGTMGERRRFCPALDLCRSDLNLSLCSHIVFRHSMTFLLTSECHLHVFLKEY